MRGEPTAKATEALREAAFAAVIAILPPGTRMVPGYFARPSGHGPHVPIRLALADDGRILELHASGWHGCPAITHESNVASVSWLVDHHPAFTQLGYRRERPVAAIAMRGA